MLVFWPFAWHKSLINLDSHYIGQASWLRSFLGTSWVVLPCRRYQLLHLAVYVNLEDANSGPHTCKVIHLHSPWLRAWGLQGAAFEALLCDSFGFEILCLVSIPKVIPPLASSKNSVHFHISFIKYAVCVPSIVGNKIKKARGPCLSKPPFAGRSRLGRNKGNPLCSMPDAMELCRDHSRSTGQGAINPASEVGIALLAELLKNLFSYGAMHRLRGFRMGDVGESAFPVTRGLVGSCSHTASSVRPHTASFLESLLTVWPVCTRI